MTRSGRCETGACNYDRHGQLQRSTMLLCHLHAHALWDNEMLAGRPSSTCSCRESGLILTCLLELAASGPCEAGVGGGASCPDARMGSSCCWLALGVNGSAWVASLAIVSWCQVGA